MNCFWSERLFSLGGPAEAEKNLHQESLRGDSRTGSFWDCPWITGDHQVWVCMHMHVCAYVCARVHTCRCVGVSACVCLLCVCMCGPCVLTCMCAHVHVHVRAHMCVLVCVCLRERQTGRERETSCAPVSALGRPAPPLHPPVVKGPQEVRRVRAAAQENPNRCRENLSYLSPTPSDEEFAPPKTCTYLFFCIDIRRCRVISFPTIFGWRMLLLLSHVLSVFY